MRGLTKKKNEQIDMNENKLIRQIYTKQSVKAFEQIVLQWQNYIYKRCYAAANKDQEKAMNLAQEVFVNIWNDLTSHRPDIPLQSLIRQHVVKVIAPLIQAHDENIKKSKNNP